MQVNDYLDPYFQEYSSLARYSHSVDRVVPLTSSVSNVSRYLSFALGTHLVILFTAPKDISRLTILGIWIFFHQFTLNLLELLYTILFSTIPSVTLGFSWCFIHAQFKANT